MKKYKCKKWKQLTEKEKEYVYQNIVDYVDHTGNSVNIGKCRIDLTDYISINGELIEAGDYPKLVIDDEAIFYDSTEGAIFENEKFKDLISLKDAAIMFNKDESTLRRNIKNGFFKEWEDCIKFGKQWVFDVKSLEKKYKEYDKFKKDLDRYLK